jgi:FixJ family two-component response regulator
MPYQALQMASFAEHGPLIAIIDDDESVRRSLTRLMRSRGFAACAFASAEAFMQSAVVHGASCLVSDVHMPGMSGLELQAWMTAKDLRIPVVFITAFHDLRIQGKALEAGAVCFLKKPFNSKDLIECVERALRSSPA